MCCFFIFTLLNIFPDAQVCDATGDAILFAAGLIKK